MSRLDMVGRIVMQDAFSKTFNDLESQSTRAESAFSGLGTAMAALGGTAALVGLAKGAYELTALGAQAQTVENIFGNLTAANKIHGDELLAGLKAASRGAVAETDLMITANRALLAGGAQLASELPRLFEIARASAAATGQDIGYIFETLVKGIVKASPLLIDNAEIYLKIGDAVDNYAKSIGKSTDELTQQERQLSTLNAVLEDGGKFIEQMGLDSQTAAEDVASLGAAWDDVKRAIGEALVEAGAARFVGDIAVSIRTRMEGAEEVSDLRGELNDLLRLLTDENFSDPELQQTLRELNEDFARLNDEDLSGFEQNLRIIIATNRQLRELVPVGKEVGEVLRRISPPGEWGSEFKIDVEMSGDDEAERKIEEFKSASPITLDIDVRVGRGIDSALNRLARGGDIGLGDYTGELSRMSREWAQLQDSLAFATVEEYQFIAEQWLGMNERRLQDTYATEEEIQKAIRDTGETYAGLEGKIKSALSIGVDVTAEDMRLTELGLYQDKALESARRLADIVNQGTASPWAATFDIPTDVLAQGEDAVKRWAASLQRDVEDLARPDLINWDAFLANFQSQSEREAAQALTIDIAVEKLSAAGLLSGSIEDKKKEVAKALGLAVPEMTIATLFKTSEDAPAQLRDEITEGKGEFHVKVKFDAPDVPPGLELLGGAQNLFTATTAKIGTDKPEMPFLPVIIKPSDWTAWVAEQVGEVVPSFEFIPSLVTPDDWRTWAGEQVGTDKPSMPFLPMILKPDNWTTWATDQTGDVKLEIPMSPVVPEGWTSYLEKQLAGSEPEIPFLPMIVKPDDVQGWVSDQMGAVSPELTFSPTIQKPDDVQAWSEEHFGPEPVYMMFKPQIVEPENWDKWMDVQIPSSPEFDIVPRLFVEDEQVSDMGKAMTAALGRSPDPFVGAGSRIGEIMMTGIDKAIDEGADDFFERMAKRLVPDILRFIPRIGGTTPTP